MSSSSDTNTELTRGVVSLFVDRFGEAPDHVAIAPGRVNLIGEHVDYNDGFVLPMAIDRFVVMAGARAPGFGEAGTGARPRVEVYSETVDSTAVFALDELSKAAGSAWSAYVAGVISGLVKAGIRPPPFRAVVTSDLPLGGGVSSSAALEVATATLVEALSGKALDPVEKALVCQRAEHDFAGVPCGIMDQFCSALAEDGHLMLLDCRDRSFRGIPFDGADVRVLIANTNVHHDLAESEYARRRRACEEAARVLEASSYRDVTLADIEARRAELGDVRFRRARHVVTEIARTVEAAEAIEAGDWPRVGELMYASHDSLRDDYEVSCRELDVLVDAARSLGSAGGVIGARMTGGGFGGCAVMLVRATEIDSVTSEVSERYRAATAIDPILFVTRPAGGARVISVDDL